MNRITTRKELVLVAKQLGVRADWHEPDEQGITVEVHGSNFDNAGFWPEEFAIKSGGTIELEKCVFIKKDGKAVAVVNLATLFAWATGYEADKEVSELDDYLEAERAWKAFSSQYRKDTE